MSPCASRWATATGGDDVTTVALERASLGGRLWGAVLGAWGAFTGVLPHVLHHVGPLAGAALLAGATGRLLFAALGVVAAIPFLSRLRRRFDSWKAPRSRSRSSQ